MNDNITIKRIPGGYRVTRFKQAGVDAGEVPLATLCGGMLGAELAMAVALAAAHIGMIDDVYVEGEDGVAALVPAKMNS